MVGGGGSNCTPTKKRGGGQTKFSHAIWKSGRWYNGFSPLKRVCVGWDLPCIGFTLYREVGGGGRSFAALLLSLMTGPLFITTLSY